VIHIFYGSDSFSRGEAFDEFRASLDSDGSLATNTQYFQAREATADEVMAACAAAPFLGDCRLVVVSGLLQASEGVGRGKKAASASPVATAWQPLVDFLPQLPDSTELVFLDGSASTAGPLFAAIKPRAEIRNFPAPDPRTLDRWVMDRAKKLGIKIEPRAAKQLVTLAAGQETGRGAEYLDTWSLASELDKLATYANGETIREQDVLELTPRLREEKTYFLCDALVERRPAQAAKILGELQAQREPGQLVLSTIAGRYRRLAIARDMIDRGESGEAIRKELDAKPGYGFDKLLEQAGRYSLEDCRKAYRRIVEAEFSAKSGLSDEGLELTALVQDLAGRG
jgi:DNA polymerase III subunit delta